MIYTDGTIAIKAGSPIVTGTGTQWKKNIHGVAPGQLISIENGTAPVSMMIDWPHRSPDTLPLLK